MAEEKKVGRPRMFDTPAAMQSKIDEYFKDCPDKRKVVTKEGVALDIPTPTITGLALFLGFVNRASMYDYEDEPEFTNTIKKARAFIENEYEKMLSQGNCTGAIFALKNFGWKDKTEQETTMRFNKLPEIRTDDGKPIEFKVGDE